MSTILKALRRLEEDGSTSEADQADGLLPVAHRGATDELRDRILTEEAAAEAVSEMHGDLERKKRIVFSVVAAVASAIILVGFGVYWIAPGVAPGPRETGLAEAPRPDSPASPVPPIATTQARLPSINGITDSATDSAVESQIDSQSTPTPSSAPEEMALAAVVPTTAVVEGRTMRSTSTPTRVAAPTQERTTRTPRVAPGNARRATTSRTSARTTPVTPPPSPATTTARSVAEPRRDPAPTLTAAGKPPKVSAPRSESISKAKPAAPTPESDAGSVNRVDHRGLPDLTVLRTAWHPDAERRSAKLRLEDNEKIMTLHEGDAVAGFVLQSITPSAVVFKVGDVEIQRRVGQTGSGG